MEFYDRGIQYTKLAVAQDNNNQYPESLRYYVLAIECLLTGLKCKKT